MRMPHPSADNVLRHVTLKWHPEYSLLTWEPEGAPRCSTGQYKVGYAFCHTGSLTPLFIGEDYGCSPFNAIDSDAALVGLLGFLTLRPGDTDSEYFESYTETQLDWAVSCAEELSMYGQDGESTEDSFGPYADRFVDVDGSES